MKTDAEIENNNHSVVSNFHSTVINKSTSIESLQTTPAVDSKIIQNRISSKKSREKKNNYFNKIKKQINRLKSSVEEQKIIDDHTLITVLKRTLPYSLKPFENEIFPSGFQYNNEEDLLFYFNYLNKKLYALVYMYNFDKNNYNNRNVIKPNMSIQERLFIYFYKLLKIIKNYSKLIIN